MSHSHTWDSVTGKPSTFTPSNHSHTWGEISSKPSTFTPSAHNHNDIYYTKTEITNLFSPVSVFTTEEPEDGAATSYTDGTLICVYEEV